MMKKMKGYQGLLGAVMVGFSQESIAAGFEVTLTANDGIVAETKP